MLQKSTLRQITVLIPVYITSTLSGMGYAWAAANMKYLRSTEFGIPLTYEQSTIVASLLHVGRMVGAISNMVVFSKSGRKVPIILASILMLISCLVVANSKSATAIFASRFIFGFAVGTCDAFEVMYIGEVSMKEIRGVFMTYFIVFYYVGLLLQYTLSYYLTYEEVATIMVVLALLFLLSCYCLIESPYYLALNGSAEKASKVLSWLRATDAKQVESELEEIRNMDTAISYSEFIRQFSNPEVYKSFCIILSLGVIASTLMNTTTCFANFIIPDVGFVSSNHFALIFTCIPLFVTFVSTVFIDRFGRRILLIASLFLNLLLNAVMTVMYFLHEKSIVQIPYFSWIAFGMVVVYLLIFSMATYPPVMALRTELFPPAHKIVGTNMCMCLNATSNFVWAIVFLMVIQTYGMFINFLVLFFACVVGIMFVYYLVPETKGKTLPEIQLILKGKQPILC